MIEQEPAKNKCKVRKLSPVEAVKQEYQDMAMCLELVNPFGDEGHIIATGGPDTGESERSVWALATNFEPESAHWFWTSEESEEEAYLLHISRDATGKALGKAYRVYCFSKGEFTCRVEYFTQYDLREL